MSAAPHDRHERLLLVTLIVIASAFLLGGLGVRDLWDIDEGMHAATARDMVVTGDWIVPRLNDEPFFDKPPLFNWLTALSFLALGFTEFAARLPAALLGIGGVVVTWGLGRRLFDARTAFMGGIVLLTSIEYMVLSRSVMHDICLLFFITLTLYLFWVGYEDERRRRWCFLLAWGATAFAVLAKGPVGFVVPAMVVGSFLIAQRRLGLVREMRLVWGPVLFLAIAAPWYVLISLRDESYAGHFFIKQNVGYFLSSESRHPRPFWFYVPAVFGGLFPWSCFLPTAIIHPLREGWRRLAPGTVFLLLWFAVTFVFFSIARSKLPTYILVLFPAAALLIAAVWRDMLAGREERGLRAGFIISTAFLPGIALVCVVFALFVAGDDLETRFGFDLGVLRVMTIVPALTTLAAFGLLLARRYRAAFAGITISVAVTLAIFLVGLAPKIAPFRSTRELALMADAMVAPGAEIAYYRRLTDSILFYTDRRLLEIHDPKGLKDYFDTDERRVCVLKSRHLEDERVRSVARLVEVRGDRALISNQPGP